MTNVLILLAFIGAAAGAVASALIWTLLSDPAGVATAIVAGDVRALVSALVAAWR